MAKRTSRFSPTLRCRKLAGHRCLHTWVGARVGWRSTWACISMGVVTVMTLLNKTSAPQCTSPCRVTASTAISQIKYPAKWQWHETRTSLSARHSRQMLASNESMTLKKTYQTSKKPTQGNVNQAGKEWVLWWAREYCSYQFGVRQVHAFDSNSAHAMQASPCVMASSRNTFKTTGRCKAVAILPEVRTTQALDIGSHSQSSLNYFWASWNTGILICSSHWNDPEWRYVPFYAIFLRTVQQTMGQ